MGCSFKLGVLYEYRVGKLHCCGAIVFSFLGALRIGGTRVKSNRHMVGDARRLLPKGVLSHPRSMQRKSVIKKKFSEQNKTYWS